MTCICHNPLTFGHQQFCPLSSVPEGGYNSSSVVVGSAYHNPWACEYCRPLLEMRFAAGNMRGSP